MNNIRKKQILIMISKPRNYEDRSNNYYFNDLK